MRLELKTYQEIELKTCVKQLWTKRAKFKRYVKVWKEKGGFFFNSSLSFSVLAFFSFRFAEMGVSGTNGNSFR